MANVIFEEGKKYVSSSGIYNTAEYTPVYAVVDGERKFLRNLVKPLTGDYKKYDYKKSLTEVFCAKVNLLKHHGKYFLLNGQFDDPFELLEFVKGNGYTLEVVRSFYIESPNSGYMDFHGNCSEYSCAFHYRFYDKAMFERIKETVSGMKQKIR